MVLPILNLKKMNHPDVSATRKYLGQIYSKARNHITNIFSSLPASVSDGLDDISGLIKNGKMSPKGSRTLDTLESNLNELKGKRSTHKDRLLKKKLRNQLKKQKMKEEFRIRKKELKKVMKDGKSVKENLESEDIKYNKLDFEDEESVVTKKKFKKERPRVEKDPASALKRIDGLNNKITKLTEGGNKEKAKEIAMNDKWKCALLKAEGLKVKDNPTLLKKTIKKKQNQKNKSSEKWKERVNLVDKKKEEAQKKRKENIMKKKKDKKKNKIKKSVKKGRVVI